MRSLQLTAVAVGAFMLGCNSDPPKKQAPPPPPFAANEPAPNEGPAVFLRGRAGGASGHVLVDVVARGIDRDIHGAAFRLHWDPAQLGFDSAYANTAGAAWSSGGLFLAKEGAPGELVVVWTEKGGTPGMRATEEKILGTLDLQSKSTDASIDFRPDRSTLRDPGGAPITVDWRGGHMR